MAKILKCHKTSPHLYTARFNILIPPTSPEQPTPLSLNVSADTSAGRACRWGRRWLQECKAKTRREQRHGAPHPSSPSGAREKGHWERGKKRTASLLLCSEHPACWPRSRLPNVGTISLGSCLQSLSCAGRARLLWQGEMQHPRPLGRVGPAALRGLRMGPAATDAHGLRGLR